MYICAHTHTYTDTGIANLIQSITILEVPCLYQPINGEKKKKKNDLPRVAQLFNGSDDSRNQLFDSLDGDFHVYRGYQTGF